MSFGGSGGSSYYDLARKGQIYMAQAIVTAQVGYGTAAGTGGPLLWNGTGGTTAGVRNQQVDAVILGVSWSNSVASTVATMIGLTGGAGQTAAPTATTAIDGITSTLIRGGTTATLGAGNSCNVYRIGTVSTAGAWFMPLGNTPTTPLTAMDNNPDYCDLAGMFIVPPGSWIAVSSAATASTSVIQVSLVWAEIPRL
jgi:hypothetical protein